MAREDKARGRLGGPASVDKVEVVPLVPAVDFVPHERVAEMGEVHVDLMHTPRARAATLADVDACLRHALHAGDRLRTTGGIPRGRALHHAEIFFL